MDAPLKDLMRGYKAGLRARSDSDNDGPPTLYGIFTPFDEWSEINSMFEGNFLERTVKGAFTKTIKENRASVKVLYDHGHDQQLCNKPLGPLTVLREDPEGPYYEVPLIDTDYNRNFIIPALEAGLLGASYRFAVMREEWVDEPGTSSHNPKGLPERTIKEARLYELGPVTFPAFEGATAKLRSLTDNYHDLSTSPRRAAPEGHPVEGDAATSSNTDAPPVVAPVGLTPAEREASLRAFILKGA